MAHAKPSGPLGGIDTTVKHHRIGDPEGQSAAMTPSAVSADRKPVGTTVTVKGAPAAPLTVVADEIVEPVADEIVEPVADDAPASNKIDDVLEWVADDQQRAMSAHWDETQANSPRKRLLEGLAEILDS